VYFNDSQLRGFVDLTRLLQIKALDEIGLLKGPTLTESHNSDSILKSECPVSTEFVGDYFDSMSHLSSQYQETNSFNDSPSESSSQFMSANCYPCPQCDQVFSVDYFLQKHLKYNHKSKTGKLKCDFCDFTANFRSQILIHSRKHTGERPYSCSIGVDCKATFAHAASLESHMTKCHGKPKSFVCDICQRTFATKNCLKVHYRIHTNEKPFVCNVCGRLFRQMAGLTQHRDKHHPL